jgi:hypothetical protein
MTKKQEGSTQMPGLQKAEGKKKFKEQVEKLDIERKLRLIYALYTPSLVQSDATVRFFAAKFGIDDQIVTVSKLESGPIVHDYFRFSKGDENELFTSFKCSEKKRLFCDRLHSEHHAARPATCAHQPKSAQSPGKLFFKFIFDFCSFQAPVDQYDEFGRSIHLNQLFEAVEMLRKAGCDMSKSFGDGIDERWVSMQVSICRQICIYLFV